MFSDPWNPSSTEIRQWAYAESAIEPCQDWDLALSWAGHEREYMAFAADYSCPNRQYFLHVLYLMVGDAVRSKFQVKTESTVRSFVELAKDCSSSEVRLWRERTLRLLRHPEAFEYDAWCSGGLARDGT